jgi:hypothetical protein
VPEKAWQYLRGYAEEKEPHKAKDLRVRVRLHMWPPAHPDPVKQRQLE